MILVIGEALIDLIGDSARPAEFSAVIGGANANVALALAARGQPHRFLGRISTDSFGSQIRDHLSRGGVNLELCVVASEPTTLAIASIDADGVAEYSFYIEGTADWGWTATELPSESKLAQLNPQAIQFGCLTMAIGPGNAVITEWLKGLVGKLTLSHDLNLRPALGFERPNELARVLALNEVSDIIKASDADLEWLFGLPAGSNLDEICHHWSAGSRLVVLTRGERGASAYRNNERIDVPAPSINLVDTVGAGDTFMAAFLSALSRDGALGTGARLRLAELEDGQLRQALLEAVTAAAITCERRGCQPPTSSEIQARLN
jgi:fructokinase